MAASQTPERRAALRATCLLAVMVAAKMVVLSQRDIPESALWPIALFWQDVLIASLIYLVEAGARSPTLGWLLYGAAVLYTSVNVPVALVLGSVLTRPMLRAAGGPLGDSIARYATTSNVAGVAGIVVLGVVLPMIIKPFSLKPWAALCAVFFVVLGTFATHHVDARGLHRNAIATLFRPSSLTERDIAGRAPVAPLTVSRQRGAPAMGLEHLKSAAAGRNVVLVVLESTAAGRLGLHGAAPDPMPRLTEFARQAVVFDAAYAVYPESVKGLWSMLCSRYPPLHTPAEALADVPCTSLAAHLRNAGYRTALFHSGRFAYLGMSAVIGNRGFDVLEDAGAISGRVHSSFGVDEPSTVARMLRWIDSLSAEEKFFVMYMPIAGHHPYSGSDGPFAGDTDAVRYLNALHEGDVALGGFLDGLIARGLYERTLIVLYADHGEAFGEHPDNVGHSFYLYEENVRVPYLLALPGLTKKQRRVERPVSLIDVTPTTLDLLGVPPDAAHQGTSNLSPAAGPVFFYTDYSLPWLGLRERCWKYLYEADARRSKLFDVCRDPHETRDRSGELADLTRAYRQRVLRPHVAQPSRNVDARARERAH